MDMLSCSMRSCDTKQGEQVLEEITWLKDCLVGSNVAGH